MMTLKYNGSDTALNIPAAEHREGNAVLNSGDSFEVPQKLGKSILSSSAQFEEVASKSDKEDKDK